MQNRPKIGSSGDFYTSPHVHSGFGYCIAEQIHEMWQVCQSPEKFFIVEFGPGTGLLARDILTYLQKAHYEMFQCTEYHLVETSLYLLHLQKDELAEYHEKCFWSESISHLPLCEGVFLSNEFLDAFPVHKLKKINDEIREIYVTYTDGAFQEVPGVISNPLIMDYMVRLRILLEEGQEIEVNLDGVKWLGEAALKLQKGFIITIDYGYTTKELTEPFRFEGTLMSYVNHRSTADVLSDPGKQDITAHVNFSALMDFGEEYGLKTCGYTSQMRFLANLNIFERTKNFQGLSQKDILGIKRLIMPEGMGERFKVLIQSKGFCDCSLTGLKGIFSALK
ncbi:MAG: SAM-dependent methyltransferase [Bacillota bacterium]